MLRHRNRSNRGWRHLVAAAALLVQFGPITAEELVISDHAIVNTGHHIYMRACAACHGRDARGGGPFAPMLVATPTDLTVLAKGNGGRFPFERVLEIISGNELMPAHGARDMPIWGQEFADEAATLGMDSRVLARGRMLELMSYLEFVQQK